MALRSRSELLCDILLTYLHIIDSQPVIIAIMYPVQFVYHTIKFEREYMKCRSSNPFVPDE
jgi:hypothetical protein